MYVYIFQDLKTGRRSCVDNSKVVSRKVMFEFFLVSECDGLINVGADLSEVYICW